MVVVAQFAMQWWELHVSMYDACCWQRYWRTLEMKLDLAANPKKA